MYIYLIVGAVSLFYIFYVIVIKKKYHYWKDKNVKGPDPLPVVGNFGNVMIAKESIDQFLWKNYEAFPEEQVVGLYRAFTPVLLIRDPELIKQVLIKDFTVFQDRGQKQGNSKINENLFSSEGETWRILRQKMTPLFTSGKLKNMTPLMENCIDGYINYVNKLVQNNIDEEIRSLQSKLTLEVIGSCAFGLDLHTFSDKENEFTEMSKKLLIRTSKFRFWLALEMIIPGIRKMLPNISDTTSHFQDFFINLVRNIIGERGGKPSMRKDFMDLMIELRDQGKVGRRMENGISEIEIDDAMIAAQALVFYIAGFETSAATTSFLLYELALHPDLQERLYQEINAVYKNYNGKITYDSISQMEFLEMVFDETLRKHAVVGFLVRKSLSDYNFPGTNINIKKGTMVFISPSGLQHDPKYFPNPNDFDPIRFSPENRNNIPHCVYLPFGDGPRNCIGMRFARVQSMMAIAAFVKNFKVEPSEKTKKPLRYNPKGVTLTSEDGIWLKISKRDVL